MEGQEAVKYLAWFGEGQSKQSDDRENIQKGFYGEHTKSFCQKMGKNSLRFLWFN